MTLFELTCPFELSDPAFITCMSISLGVPVPILACSVARLVMNLLILG